MRGEADRIRLASEALARARADAWARGERPASQRRSPSPTAAPTDHRARRDEPQPLTAAVGGLLSARGWRDRAAVGSVFGRWEEVVGAELAAHTRPESFADGELVIAADSPAWATQVRLLAPNLLRRLSAELGAGTVRRVRVEGPTRGVKRTARVRDRS